MEPTRCEGGCGRWIHHPKRFNASRRRRFCVFCQRVRDIANRTNGRRKRRES